MQNALLTKVVTQIYKSPHAEHPANPSLLMEGISMSQVSLLGAKKLEGDIL